MKALSVAALFLVLAALASPPQSPEDSHVGAVYFWKAKPGKLEEYNKYIREFAEPIDEEARRGLPLRHNLRFQSAGRSLDAHARLSIKGSRAASRTVGGPRRGKAALAP